jgi:hypothetical protein
MGLVGEAGLEGPEAGEGSGSGTADTAGIGFASGDPALRVVSCGVCWRNLRRAIRRWRASGRVIVGRGVEGLKGRKGSGDGVGGGFLSCDSA